MTRFEVRRTFLDEFDVQQAGGETILEYWIPAERLDELNANIVGRIQVVRTFGQDPGDDRPASHPEAPSPSSPSLP